MSIYIPGMKMPNDGEEQIICLRVTNREVECFDPTGEDESVFYEAVELPPHGRLIDGDLLLWVLANTDVKFESYEDWEKLCDYIRAAPTIIPAEEGKI